LRLRRASQQTINWKRARAVKLTFLLEYPHKSMSGTSRCKSRCFLIIIIFGWRMSFLQEAGKLYMLNEKCSMLADKTCRTRFETRFQLSGNERCNVRPLAFFLPLSSFYFRALQSGHLWTYKERVRIGTSKRRAHIAYNNAIYGEMLLSWRISAFVHSGFKNFVGNGK